MRWVKMRADGLRLEERRGDEMRWDDPLMSVTFLHHGASNPSQNPGVVLLVFG